MIKRKREEIHYKPYSFRLHKKTVEMLSEMRGSISWNKFFLGIIREKQGIKCYFCGTHNNLEKHHIKAVKDGGTDDEENLIYLCFSCHKKTKNWGNKKNNK